MHPELWDQGIASDLMQATVAMFDRWGTAHAGLFTFAQSARHLGLYQKFGFWPRFLTPVMAKPVSAGHNSSSAIRYTELPPAERARALDACRELTATAYEGLDLEREIRDSHFACREYGTPLVLLLTGEVLW